MDVVIYTEALEPITVVKLSAFAIDMLRSGQRFRVPIPVRFNFARLAPESAVAAGFPTCEIWGETISRGNARGLLVFASDEVKALSLESTPLPGQRDEWEQQFRRGFAHAIVNAIGR